VFEHRVLLRRRERLGAAYDDDGRAAEERWRAEIGERVVDARIVVVAPEDPGAEAAAPTEPRPERREPALDQERLLAVEEVERTKRPAREPRQRIRGAGWARPAERAQNPSMLWR
jgi:hypothetical protein